MFAGLKYEPREVDLAPGDVLVLYTDGVVEIEQADGTEFGVQRLSVVVQGLRSLPAAEIIGAVAAATRDFAGTDVYQDDFTLVIVGRRADGP